MYYFMVMHYFHISFQFINYLGTQHPNFLAFFHCKQNWIIISNQVEAKSIIEEWSTLQTWTNFHDWILFNCFIYDLRNRLKIWKHKYLDSSCCIEESIKINLTIISLFWLGIFQKWIFAVNIEEWYFGLEDGYSYLKYDNLRVIKRQLFAALVDSLWGVRLILFLGLLRRIINTHIAHMPFNLFLRGWLSTLLQKAWVNLKELWFYCLENVIGSEVIIFIRNIHAKIISYFQDWALLDYLFVAMIHFIYKTIKASRHSYYSGDFIYLASCYFDWFSEFVQRLLFDKTLFYQAKGSIIFLCY